MSDQGGAGPGTRYPVGAVVRLDLYQFRNPELATEVGEDLRKFVTVKEVLPTYEEAVAEVERLTNLKDDSSVVYFAQGSRFYPAGRKNAAGEPLEFRVGRIYEDCAFHPVLCTSIEDEDDGDVELTGISLIDGSAPRSCSVAHCGPVPMTLDEALAAKEDFPAYVARRTSEIG